MTDKIESLNVRLKGHSPSGYPVYSIPLALIVVEKDRARKEFPNMLGFAENIAKHGLINPVTVQSREDGKYVLIAGERRYRAVSLLACDDKQPAGKWDAIDARLIDDLSALQRKELELDENIHRENLTWQERVALTAQIHEIKTALNPRTTDTTKRWDQNQTAEHLGVDKGTVSTDLKLAKKLQERPDLAKAVAHLPKPAAIRELQRIEDAERVERLASSGQIKFTSDVLLGDCTVELPKLASESYDLLLTDGPFGMASIADEFGEESKRENMNYLGMLKETDNLSPGAVRELMAKVMPEIFRILKPGAHAYWFFAYDLYPDLVRIARESGFGVQPTPLTWYKGRTTAPFVGYLYAPCSEPILYTWKPSDPANPESKPKRLAEPCKTLLEFKPPSKRQHPFEKPVELLEYLIKQSTQKGDKVLDPFAGSGATIIAARNAGRSALGIELNEDHWKRTQGRLLGEL